MADGKFGAVSGLMSRMQMMNNISEQLAAIKTQAYKKGVPTFEAELAEANSGMASQAVNYVRPTGETIDFTPGQLEYTGDPLHVAINGDGFFQVQQADGSFGYTRNGAFKLDSQGVLNDSNGRQVMNENGGPITLETPNVDIAADGTIWSAGEQVGRIGVFKFDDNKVLQRAQGSMFVPSDGSQPTLMANPQLAQKNLETSNVNMMETMVRMTENLRAFESIQKVLRIYSDMDSKANDIGTVQ